jgi:hypothetical protein
MDESIKKNLIAQNETLNEISKQIKSVENEMTENEAELNELKCQSKKIREQLEQEGYKVPQRISQKTVEEELISSNDILSYEEVTNKNYKKLSELGLMDKEFDSLFSKEDLSRIERELSSPIQREKWDKWDFVAVLTAGVGGVIADVLTDNINSKLMNRLGGSDTLHNWAKETKGLSIDYQGPAFGGNFHEGFSSGHDILRPFKAIWQIKSGVFQGLKQTPTGFEWVKSPVNQYGNQYDTHEFWESFILWLKHMASDSANPTGLPFPGMSFLTEMPNHEVRKFAMGLYTHGLTLQYIIAQALAPALVELIIRGYLMGREFKEKGEINFPTAKKLKTTEMLLSSHVIVSAVNVGKVAIRCNAEGPLALRKLNIPSIVMTVRYFIPFVIKRLKLNDPVEILKRNAQEIIINYDEMILQMVNDIKKDDEFRKFLENGKQIIL